LHPLGRGNGGGGGVQPPCCWGRPQKTDKKTGHKGPLGGGPAGAHMGIRCSWRGKRGALGAFELFFGWGKKKTGRLGVPASAAW